MSGRYTSRIDASVVGQYFRGPDGHLWRLISYASQPTAEFERVEPSFTELGSPDRKERRSGVVGSLILEGFVRLVPEEEKPS